MKKWGIITIISIMLSSVSNVNGLNTVFAETDELLTSENSEPATDVESNQENGINDVTVKAATEKLSDIFPDVEFCMMVIDAIGPGTLTPDSLVDQDQLNLATEILGNNKVSVNSIKGAERLTNLTRLTISGNVTSRNGLSDLSPLSGLTKLAVLYIDYGNIVDLTPIKNVVSLTELQLNGNLITDTTPIAGLTNLRHLRLERNRNMTNFSGLAPLVNLEILQMFNTGFKDMTLLENKSKLTNLDIERNGVTDISSLNNLVSLASLNADDNSITSIASLAGLTALNSVSISENKISDLSPLNGKNLANLFAQFQDVLGPSVEFSGSNVSVVCPIIPFNNTNITISGISNGGTYDPSTNKLSFNLNNLNVAGGTITFSWSSGNFAGVYAMPYTIEAGSLKLTVPSNVEFGSIKLGSANMILPWTTGADIIVTDERVVPNGWTLTAKLTSGSTMGDVLTYNSSQSLVNLIIIAQGNGAGQKIVNSGWGINPENVVPMGINVDYSNVNSLREDVGTIEWTIIPNTLDEVNE